MNPGLHRSQDFELWSRFFEHAPLFGVDTPLGGWRFHSVQKSGHDEHEGCLAEAESFIVRGRYSLPQKWWRRLAFECVPLALQPRAARLGGLYPAKNIRFNHHESRWEIVRVFA